MDTFFLIISLILTAKIALCFDCYDENVIDQCRMEKSCEKCIQKNSCCKWCYMENFKGNYSCDIAENLLNEHCNGDSIENNFETQVFEERNEDFTDVFSFEQLEEANQIKPQHLKVTLRKDTPLNISFSYKAAKNYPLELYYLMDLSNSMKDHLELMQKISEPLSDKLMQLSTNHKVAFGSYMDKVAMPFYLMDSESIKNPCLISNSFCDPGYLFKHKLNFTNDISEFIDKISQCKITANLDNLDGGLDAIMQVLVCDKSFGWSKLSRKIVLVPTQSTLHSAGDGILAGAVKKHNGQCLMDSKGNYLQPLIYDYPSIEETLQILIERKVNIIFAPQAPELVEYYRAMARLMPDNMFVGKLENNTNNILSLIEEGYNNFMKLVKFFVNSTIYPDLDVEFFAQCNNGEFNKSDACHNNNVQDKVFNFTVQLNMRNSDRKKDTIFIEEKNIQDKIRLDIEYVGSCNCENSKIVKKCENGKLNCGQCICNEGWHGELCNEECLNNLNSCRQVVEGYTHNTCEGNGDCICGKCQCQRPFIGDFCQYECPVNPETKLICSGRSQGFCKLGECFCAENFSGVDCSCSRLQENCETPAMNYTCSNHGSCVCNKCNCNEDFVGAFCETKRGINELCEIYNPMVQEFQQEKENRDGGISSGHENVTIFKISQIGRFNMNLGDIDQTNLCETVYFITNQRCTIKYYYSPLGNRFNLFLEEPYCVMSAKVLGIWGAFIVAACIILLGIVILAIFKLKIHQQEKREFDKFLRMQNSEYMHEMNPIYSDPNRYYVNPIHAKK